MSKLYLVPTPIGNLEDITMRAIRILKEVDIILAEDTRKTSILLKHYSINKPVLAHHKFNEHKTVPAIVDRIKLGESIALVSDAGTPGISDPGNKLIDEIIKNLGNQVKIIPIPGSSAVTSAASISGLPMDKFIFMGFPPTKKKRKKFFEEIEKSKYPVIFYESTYRIIRTLTELSKYLNRKAVVCRELTKKFETIYRGTIKKVIEEIEKDVIKGEFVVIIEGKK